MKVERAHLAKDLLHEMRPHQWVKNLFVLTPVVFAHKLTELATGGLAIAAFVMFCALSSAVYILNDIFDREKDRAHPLKCHRPIAAGRLPVPVALWAMGALVATSLVGAFLVTPVLAAIAGGYFLLNLAYSAILKHIVFVDLVVIALGFILRILAGAVAVDVEISPWLVLCTFLLALFLGLGKRKHELLVSGEDRAQRRRVLTQYRLPHLNMALNVTAAVTTFAYLAYTVSERAVQQFGTSKLVFTVPFIVFGLVRYMQILETHREEESPTDYIVKDVAFVANLGLWGLTVSLLIYIF